MQKIKQILVVMVLLNATATPLAAETIDEINQNIAASESEYNTSNEELTKQQEEYDQLVAESKEINDNLAAINDEITQKQANIETIESQLPTLKVQAENSLAALQKNLHVNYLVDSLMNSNNDDFMSKMRMAQAANRLTESSMNGVYELIDKENQIKEDMEHLEVLSSSLAVQQEEAQSKADELTALINSSQQELLNQQSEIDSQKAQKEFLESEGCGEGDVYGVDCGVELPEVTLTAATVEEETEVEEETTEEPVVEEETTEEPVVEEETTEKPVVEEETEVEEEETNDVVVEKPEVEEEDETESVSTGFRRPLASGVVTNEYGGYDGYGTGHRGIDVANSYGTPVYAVADGAVIDAGTDVNRGNYVTLVHNVGGVNYTTTYWHMSSINVSVGQKVTSNTQVGAVGNSGIATGAHLHFGMNANSTTFSNERGINPRQYISFPSLGTWFYSR